MPTSKSSAKMKTGNREKTVKISKAARDLAAGRTHQKPESLTERVKKIPGERLQRALRASEGFATVSESLVVKRSSDPSLL